MAADQGMRSLAQRLDSQAYQTLVQDHETGIDATLPEEAPAREVSVKGFWMATHEVTNAEVAEFVKATGYKTLAEFDTPDWAPPASPGPVSASRPSIRRSRRRSTASSPSTWSPPPIRSPRKRVVQ